MKEYIMVIDPFIMDQQVYEIIDGQLKIATAFQLTKIESYTAIFELLNQAKDEDIVINLKCPKAFSDKVKDTIYTYANKLNFEQNKIVIKDI